MNDYPEYSSVIYVNKKKRRPQPFHRTRSIIAGLTLGTGVIGLVLLFLALVTAVPPAHINGQWTGRLVQDPGGIFQDYPFNVTFYQHDTEIWGTTSIHIPGDASQYGQIALTGSVAGNTVRFSETRIIAQQLNPDWRWCLKTAELHLDGDTLTGRWIAPGCPPGELQLSRVTD